MSPLIAFAVSLLPSLGKRLVDNVLPDVEKQITDKVQAVLGTTDPDKAAEKAEDPKLAAQLRVRLSEIEAEADKRQHQTQAAQLQTQLDTLKAELEDTQNARSMLTDLSEHGSVMAWGPVIVSTIVVLGFFVVLGMLMFGELPVQANDQTFMQIINIAVGALTAGFATVVSFWLGSSQGSRNKDTNALRTQHMVTSIQLDSAKNTKDIVTAQSQQTAALLDKVNQPAATAPPLQSAGAPPKDARQFHKCMAIVLQHEGGYVDDPNDPGGATKYGITHKTLAAWRGVADCTPEEVKALTVDEATEIYRAKYWNALNCDQLPAGVDLVTFDFGVNAGVGRAARTLQEAVSVKADGQVGPITISAAQRLAPEFVVNRESDLRLDYYKSLKDWGTFGDGWSRRTAETRSAALEMIG
ncbi:MAG: glycosyl hydrolase 108 family protein [Pseudomonadota bacterium]